MISGVEQELSFRPRAAEDCEAIVPPRVTRLVFWIA
jgi:hypothetical protein